MVKCFAVLILQVHFTAHYALLIQVSLCCRQGVRSSSCPDIRNPVIPDMPAEVCIVLHCTSAYLIGQSMRGRVYEIQKKNSFTSLLMFLALFLSFACISSQTVTSVPCLIVLENIYKFVLIL